MSKQLGISRVVLSSIELVRNNYFSQLLNVHNTSDIKQTEVCTAELLAPGPSRLNVKIAIAKLKKYKS
jgi:hypothetical protein